MKNQSGFTLIEMVAVIIILAIMAATALPKFADLQKEARISAMNGVAGGMRSAAALVRAKWLAAMSTQSDAVTVDGTSVKVASGTAANAGYPIADATGILKALTLEPNGNFLSSTYAPDTISIAYAGYEQTCFIEYNLVSDATGTAATVSDARINSTNC